MIYTRTDGLYRFKEMIKAHNRPGYSMVKPIVYSFTPDEYKIIIPKSKK